MLLWRMRIKGAPAEVSGAFHRRPRRVWRCIGQGAFSIGASCFVTIQ